MLALQRQEDEKEETRLGKKSKSVESHIHKSKGISQISEFHNVCLEHEVQDCSAF